MENLIKALESTLESNNWYGALFIALSIPDICGRLETPEESIRTRYERWFERYMLSKYSKPIGPEQTPHTFLSSSDCYALRCALLHEGRDVIKDQRAREMLRRFHFIEPPPKGGRIHLNQFNDVLMLQADILGIPIQVAAMAETTALGAAYLAGLAVGLWRDTTEIAGHWRAAKTYEPSMSADQRETLYTGWKRAVERAGGWAIS